MENKLKGGVLRPDSKKKVANASKLHPPVAPQVNELLAITVDSSVAEIYQDVSGTQEEYDALPEDEEVVFDVGNKQSLMTALDLFSLANSRGERGFYKRSSTSSY